MPKVKTELITVQPNGDGTSTAVSTDSMAKKDTLIMSSADEEPVKTEQYTEEPADYERPASESNDSDSGSGGGFGVWLALIISVGAAACVYLIGKRFDAVLRDMNKRVKDLTVRLNDLEAAVAQQAKAKPAPGPAAPTPKTSGPVRGTYTPPVTPRPEAGVERPVPPKPKPTTETFYATTLFNTSGGSKGFNDRALNSSANGQVFILTVDPATGTGTFTLNLDERDRILSNLSLYRPAFKPFAVPEGARDLSVVAPGHIRLNDDYWVVTEGIEISLT